MGTRHLVCVFYKGRFVIMQYGQWDGYPEGQGVVILNFLLEAGNIERLKNGLDHVYTPSEAEQKLIDDASEIIEEEVKYSIDRYNLLQKLWPALSRETSAKILEHVASATAEKRVLIDHPASWFVNQDCVWAYVVDLDDGMLEVYGGLVKKRKASNNRFNEFGPKDDTVPRFLRSFPLAALPTEADFVAFNWIDSSSDRN